MKSWTTGIRRALAPVTGFLSIAISILLGGCVMTPQMRLTEVDGIEIVEHIDDKMPP